MIRKVRVAKVEEIGESAISFHFGHVKGIAFKRNGVCKAFVNRCTHMGGPVAFCKQGTLRCAWHGADFDPVTGAAIRGQAPAGTFLKAVELVEESGIIFALLELPDDPFA
ncbi:MAG: Rieske (2Fe-2S) protein [Candidatus Uhrbacteria bacterium]